MEYNINKYFKENKLAILFCALSLLLLIVGNPFSLFFGNDDFYHIPMCGELKFFRSYRLIRPVAEMSLTIDYFLFHKNAAGYHFINFIIHLFNALLVKQFAFLLAINFNFKDKKTISWVCAILFLISACHVEAIYWVIGRTGSLATMFLLLASIFYIQTNETFNFIWLSIIFFILALFTYEVGFILPFQLVIIYFVLKFQSKKLLNFTSIYFIILACVLFFRKGLLSFTLQTNDFHLKSIKILIFSYIKLIIRSIIPPFYNPIVFITIAFCFILLIAIIFFKSLQHQKNNNKNNLLLLALFFLSAIPFITFGVSASDNESSRYTYYPCLFFIILFTILIFQISINKILKNSILVFLGCFYLFFHLKSIGDYKYASFIAKKSIVNLNINNSYKNVFLIDVPSQYNGSLIFRSHSKEVIKWFCNNLKYDSLQVVSIKKVENKNYNFTTTTIEDSLFFKTNNYNINYSNKDIIFKWIDGGMIIVNDKK